MRTAESIDKGLFLSICAPAYNEEETIERVVHEWAQTIEASGRSCEIVIGNDGSTDSTLRILERLQQQYPFLIVVTLPRNAGYGAALSTAIAASRGEYVLTLDSDGQFDASEYERLLEEMNRGDLDLVTGYRRHKADRATRIVADRAFKLLVTGLFGLPMRDPNCALKLYRGMTARSLTVDARGFPTPTELLVKAQTLGYRIGEVPITHRERAGGTTKLKALRTSWQMLLFLLFLKYKQVLYRAKVLNSL